MVAGNSFLFRCVNMESGILVNFGDLERAYLRLRGQAVAGACGACFADFRRMDACQQNAHEDLR